MNLGTSELFWTLFVCWLLAAIALFTCSLVFAVSWELRSLQQSTLVWIWEGADDIWGADITILHKACDVTYALCYHHRVCTARMSSCPVWVCALGLGNLGSAAPWPQRPPSLPPLPPSLSVCVQRNETTSLLQRAVVRMKCIKDSKMLTYYSFGGRPWDHLSTLGREVD